MEDDADVVVVFGGTNDYGHGRDDLDGILNVLTSKEVADKSSDFSVRVKKYQRCR